MNKPLHEMSNSEFYIECAALLAKMCDDLKAHGNAIADVLKQGENEHLATPLLQFTMRTSLDAMGDLLSGIDLVNEEYEGQAELVFAELRRRFWTEE